MSKQSSENTQYWLMKSEPTCYSIDDLKRDKKTLWDGVRNYQARNMMRDDVKLGDKVFFYHSNTDEIGVVGEMKVVKEAYPDPTQFDSKSDHPDPKSDPENPRWVCVDVAFVKKYPRVITLHEIKADTVLSAMAVAQKGNRLSITPVTKKQYDRLTALIKK